MFASADSCSDILFIKTSYSALFIRPHRIVRANVDWEYTMGFVLMKVLDGNLPCLNLQSLRLKTVGGRCFSRYLLVIIR